MGARIFCIDWDTILPLRSMCVGVFLGYRWYICLSAEARHIQVRACGGRLTVLNLKSIKEAVSVSLWMPGGLFQRTATLQEQTPTDCDTQATDFQSADTQCCDECDDSMARCGIYLTLRDTLWMPPWHRALGNMCFFVFQFIGLWSLSLCFFLFQPAAIKANADSRVPGRPTRQTSNLISEALQNTVMLAHTIDSTHFLQI